MNCAMYSGRGVGGGEGVGVRGGGVGVLGGDGGGLKYTHIHTHTQSSLRRRLLRRSFRSNQFFNLWRCSWLHNKTNNTPEKHSKYCSLWEAGREKVMEWVGVWEWVEAWSLMGPQEQHAVYPYNQYPHQI